MPFRKSPVIPKRLVPIFFLTGSSLFSDVFMAIAAGQYEANGISMFSLASRMGYDVSETLLSFIKVAYLVCTSTFIGGFFSTVALVLFSALFFRKKKDLLAKIVLFTNIALVAIPNISFLLTLTGYVISGVK